MKGRLKAFKKKIKELGMNKKERNLKKEGGKLVVWLAGRIKQR